MNHHGEALRRLVKDEAWVKDLAADQRKMDLPDDERAMLDFAVKLARSPEKVDFQDHQQLRDAGFADRAILEITQIIAYFSFVNRMASGLGVQLEEYWQDGRQIFV